MRVSECLRIREWGWVCVDAGRPALFPFHSGEYFSATPALYLRPQGSVNAVRYSDDAPGRLCVVLCCACACSATAALRPSCCPVRVTFPFSRNTCVRARWPGLRSPCLACPVVGWACGWVALSVNCSVVAGGITTQPSCCCCCLPVLLSFMEGSLRPGALHARSH